MKERLRKPLAGIETLERLKRWPTLRRRIMDEVYIFSAEHGAYWRAGGSGYTGGVVNAGIWSVDEALKLTGHCGPEKKIEFHSLF